MKITLKEIQLLLIRISIALLTYPICKILFIIFNHSYFTDVSFLEFFRILFFGLRFDISAVILMNVPFSVLHIIPFNFTRKRWWQIMLKTVFIIPNSIAILANCIDLEYYKYTLKRTTSDFFDLFGLGSDISTMLPQYIMDFWYVILIWMALTVFISWLYNKTKKSGVRRDEFGERNTGFNSRLPTPDSRLIARTISWLVLNASLIGLMIIGFRGGLQLRPIMTINASEYVSAKNIPLIINTPFSIIKSYGMEELEEKNYFSETELKKIFNPIHQPLTINPALPTGRHQPPSNVFIIILESFSKEYIGSLSGKKTYTPFLDSLIKESLVFDNAYANGKKSIEGIPAILAGIPALTNESYITSIYGSNQLTSVANTLKKKGYSSAFFHGGTNGTMGFDAFSSAAGFDKYFGRFEYNNEKDYDGDWGIWDEQFFQYTQKQVSQMKEPFLASLFTLSSHHPYGIPEKYKEMFAGGDLPIFKSIQYSDFSLRKFFESASKEQWFDNTLFVITADHTGPSDDDLYSNSTGCFKIPIIFYRHNGSLRGLNHRTTQQIDIMPTVLNYLGYDEEFFSFGSNALDSVSAGYAINYINDVNQIIQDDYLLQFDGNKTIYFSSLKTDTLSQSSVEEGQEPSQKNDSFHHPINTGMGRMRQKEMEKKLKAIIQVYYHAIIHNKMTAESR